MFVDLTQHTTLLRWALIWIFMNQLSASRAFVNGVLVGPTRVTWDEDGIITDVSEIRAQDAATDALLVPGFIDLQVNGIADVNVASADHLQWQRLNRLLLKSGVTSWCPTLISASKDSLAISLVSIQSRMQQQRTEHNIVASSILGAHMEGPFLGAALGAHDRRSVVDVDLHWIAQLPECVALMTVGPEQENSAAAVRLLRQQGIAVSLGHTRATEQQFLDAKEAGAKMVTHLFNAMSGVHHREDGVALTALTDDEIFASIIVDLEHVSLRAVQLAFRAKPHRMVLITDSVRANTISAPRLNDGTLAGSVLSMDQALRNTVLNCSVPLSVALISATRNPAEILGLRDRGDISVGKRADLVLLTHELSVLQTVSCGLFYDRNND
jgi:N-acetylglucosamine-6-phosphate deacetylase